MQRDILCGRRGGLQPAPGAVPELICVKRRKRQNTMPEKMKCEHCGKDAIGYQGFGCGSEYVCCDHASSFVLALKPGEKQVSGDCYFERY